MSAHQGNGLAAVLPVLLAFLEPDERLVLRQCRRAFLSKRVRLDTLCIEDGLFERFRRHADFDIEHSLSVAGSSVTHLIVHEARPSCFFGSFWPKFRQTTAFCSLKTLTVCARTGGLLEKVWALCTSLGLPPTSLELHLSLDTQHEVTLAPSSLADLSSVSSLRCGPGALVDFPAYAHALTGLRRLSLYHGHMWDYRPVFAHVMPGLEAVEFSGWSLQHGHEVLARMPGLRELRMNGDLVAPPPSLRQHLRTLVWTDAREISGVNLSCFSALRVLSIDNVLQNPQSMTSAVYSLVGQLESLTTINVAFPTDQLRAPNLVSLEVRFEPTDDLEPQAGVFPECPRLASLTLSIDHAYSEKWHPGWAEESYVRGQNKFAGDVLVSGLRGWLKELSELRTLCLEGNGEKIVFVEDLPPGIRDLRLSGLRSLRAGRQRPDRDPEQTWPALARLPLQSFYLSARSLACCDDMTEAERGARLLRNATVVLREPPGARCDL